MTVTLAGESTIFFSFPLAMETLLSKRTFCVDFDELESVESVLSCGEAFTLSLSAKKIICPPPYCSLFDLRWQWYEPYKVLMKYE